MQSAVHDVQSLTFTFEILHVTKEVAITAPDSYLTLYAYTVSLSNLRDK